MADKKERKPKLKDADPKKYYTRVKNVCKAGTIASLATPFIAVFGAKWNEYIAIVEQDGSQGAVKLSVGAVCSLIMAALITYKYVKHDEKQKKQVTMVSWVVGLGLAFAICWAFQAILNDLTLILGCEFAGAVVSYGFDLGAQSANKKLEPYEDERMRAQARKDFREEEEISPE